MSSKQLTTKRCCACKTYMLKSDVTAEEMKIDDNWYKKK